MIGCFQHVAISPVCEIELWTALEAGKVLRVCFLSFGCMKSRLAGMVARVVGCTSAIHIRHDRSDFPAEALGNSAIGQMAFVK